MAMIHGVKRIDLELRVLLLVVLVNGIGESSIVPLLPSIRNDLGLSPVQAGLLWTTATLAMLAAGVPVGYAVSRFGSRALLLAAAIAMPAALVGQALAYDLTSLLAARFVFGVSFGIVWVVGPARAAAGGRGAEGTGLLVAAAGVGWLVGPVLAGLVADASTWRVASLALAALSFPVVPFVHRCAAARVGGEQVERLDLRRALGLLRSSRAIAGAAVVSALLGVVGGASNVVVPLALDNAGLSAGSIGLGFGIASAVWIASATLVGRLRASAVTLHRVGALVAVMAAAWLLPAFRLSAVFVLVFLVVSTACRSMVNALNYAVGVRASFGDQAPVVMGLLNLAWALPALVSPLLAGLAEGSASVRVVFATTALVAATVAAALLVAPRMRLSAGARPS
jgi:MFS transporter, DHA1 family, multidrug resistance protein